MRAGPAGNIRAPSRYVPTSVSRKPRTTGSNPSGPRRTASTPSRALKSSPASFGLASSISRPANVACGTRSGRSTETEIPSRANGRLSRMKSNVAACPPPIVTSCLRVR